MSVWTFSWWLPNKPPTTRNDWDHAWHSVAWPHGARWAPHGPGAAPIPQGALLCMPALPCCHKAPVGWLGVSAPWQQGSRHERGGARPLRKPGPGRATSVSRWLEPIPRPVQTQRCGLLCRDRRPVCHPVCRQTTSTGPWALKGHFCAHCHCLSPCGRQAGGLPRATVPLLGW